MLKKQVSEKKTSLAEIEERLTRAEEKRQKQVETVQKSLAKRNRAKLQRVRKMRSQEAEDREERKAAMLSQMRGAENRKKAHLGLRTCRLQQHHAHLEKVQHEGQQRQERLRLEMETRLGRGT